MPVCGFLRRRRRPSWKSQSAPAANDDANVNVATAEFQIAGLEDAKAIAELANAAFAGRGAAGWTNESHILDGARTQPAEIAVLMADPTVRFLMQFDGPELIGCVYIKTMNGAGYFGLLAVRPDFQGRGAGSRLIAEAERIARDEWRCRKMLIGVVAAHRPELLAYYERRGYVRTGRLKPWIRKTGAVPRIEGVRSEWLEKVLA